MALALALSLIQEDHLMTESRANASPLSAPRSNALSSGDRPPTKERLSVHTERTLSQERRDSGPMGSQERLHASERLSVQTHRTASKEHKENSSESRRLQEVSIQYLDETLPPPPNGLIVTRPSSSTLFDSGRLVPNDRSPIRTLSEDRVHVSLRLGPLALENEEEEELLPELPPLSKADGKKKMGETQPVKRNAQCLAQGPTNHCDNVMRGLSQDVCARHNTGTRLFKSCFDASHDIKRFFRKRMIEFIIAFRFV
ncbi:hypothetical protein F2Q68_00029363 [Brassica cretica]|uniref:Uncharacterized protein n=1 Tax=Brassica cretica TaxID=69181 RepID=A0A8S9GGR4_BRACR|nr:hypothetical protein F2Q68_00029363 [Brassica cretica]